MSGSYYAIPRSSANRVFLRVMHVLRMARERVARLADRLRRFLRPTARAQSALHRLMYGLLFPAVLGTLFVILVDDSVRWRSGPQVAFAFVFILHWCLEFVVADDPKHRASYSWLEFLGDLLTIFIMYKAFTSLPQHEGGCKDYQCVYIWVFMLPIVFLLIDWLRLLAEGQSLKRAIVGVDVLVLVATGLFMSMGLISELVRQSEVVFYLFTAVVAILSARSFCARRDRLGFEAEQSER